MAKVWVTVATVPDSYVEREDNDLTSPLGSS